MVNGASTCGNAMRRALSCSWMAGPLAAMIVASSSVALAVPLTSTVNVPDGKGGQRGVVFQGDADGTALRGTVYVDLDAYDVTATIGPDGSVSGTLARQDGTRKGVFWGQPDGRSLKGSYDLNGTVGDWSVPIRLPRPEP